MKIVNIAARCGRLVGAFFLGAFGFGIARAQTSSDAPITPRETIVLFDGKTHADLSPFYTWLADSAHEDPDRVFTVVDQIDGAPAIRASGQHWGGFTTKANYANYKLVCEFRWGTLTWGSRKDRARDSGILIHGEGEDGNAAKQFNSPWLRSIEFQIIEGGTGDIILVNGFDRGVDKPIAPTLTTSVQANGKQWDPAGKLTEFNKGRIDWQHRDPDWKDVLGFRGAKDVEKPTGQWNHLEAIVDGGNVTYFVNGVKVNEGRNSNFTSGKLLFQSEGAEIFFRNIELQPLKK
jgi:hypothetical protein